jgi:hypothetical protein
MKCEAPLQENAIDFFTILNLYLESLGRGVTPIVAPKYETAQ